MKKRFGGVILAAALILIFQTANAQFSQILITDENHEIVFNQNQFYGFGPEFSRLMEFNTPGGGARAAGMGGAQLALAKGEMAFSWNPAALIYTDKAKIGIDFLSKSDKFTGVHVEHRFWDPPNSVISPFELDFGHLSLNYGGFSVPFSLESDSDVRFLAVAALPLSIIPILTSSSDDLQLSVGGGYRHIFDLESETGFEGFDNQRINFKQQRGIDAVSFGAAAKIYEGIGFGWNMNAYVRGSETNSGVDNILLDVNQISDTRSDTTAIGFHQKEKSTYSGFNMDFGLSGDFGIIKAGAVIHTPYKLNQSMVLTAGTTNIYDLSWVDRVDNKYEFPLSASFGIGLVPLENLTLAFDFDYRPLSKAKFSIDWEQLIYDSLYNESGEIGWQDVNQFRVGAEYKIDAKFVKIPLRAGFRNEPSVANELLNNTWDISMYPNNEFEFAADTTFGDQITTNIITLGTGFEFEKIWLNVAYQFGNSSYNRRVVYNYQDLRTVPPGTVQNVTDQVYEIKRDYSRLYFSMGMYF